MGLHACSFKHLGNSELTNIFRNREESLVQPNDNLRLQRLEDKIVGYFMLVTLFTNYRRTLAHVENMWRLRTEIEIGSDIENRDQNRVWDRT
jgi:hypothetical protein